MRHLLGSRRARIFRRRVRAIPSIVLAAAVVPLKVLLRLTGYPRATPGIYLTSTKGWRYPAFLAHCLTSVTTIECRARDIPFLLRTLPFRTVMRRVVVRAGPLRSPIVIENKFPLRAGSASSPRRIRVDRSYFSGSEGRGRHVLPYFAHPDFYGRALHRECRTRRDRPRRIRIFFAGTVDPDTYTEQFQFDMLDRATIIRYVHDTFGDSVAVLPARHLLQVEHPIRLSITFDTRDRTDKHELELEDYVEILASADFVIAPPGRNVPTCHNLIEAMSVGAIPITNYAHLMYPPLEHGRSCLAFSDLESLRRVIEEALEMPADGIASLREGVLAYYDAHLDPEAAGTNLVAALERIDTLVVNEETALP